MSVDGLDHDIVVLDALECGRGRMRWRLRIALIRRFRMDHGNGDL